MRKGSASPPSNCPDERAMAPMRSQIQSATTNGASRQKPMAGLPQRERHQSLVRRGTANCALFRALPGVTTHAVMPLTPWPAAKADEDALKDGRQNDQRRQHEDGDDGQPRIVIRFCR